MKLEPLVVLIGVFRRLARKHVIRRGQGALRVADNVQIASPMLIQIHGAQGSVQMDEGVTLDHGVILNARGPISIGSSAYISAYSIIGSEIGILIGERVAIGPHVVIVDSDKEFSDINNPIIGQGHRSNPVVIGNDCWIGANVSILAGSELGNHSVVAAGSVVRGKFPENVLIAGAPARIIRDLAD